MAPPRWSRATEGTRIHDSLQVGKYLVSPLTRRTDDGAFSSAVSIRSGRGSMTHDRVMRFVPVFDTPDLAARFALAQAMAWIGRPAAPIEVRPTPDSERDATPCIAIAPPFRSPNPESVHPHRRMSAHTFVNAYSKE